MDELFQDAIDKLYGDFECLEDTKKQEFQENYLNPLCDILERLHKGEPVDSICSFLDRFLANTVTL